MHLIERTIELKNIHARLPENAEIATVCILPDQLAHLLFSHAARFYHAGDLQFCVLQTDVRIEAAALCGDRVRRHRRGFAQTIFRPIRG